MVRDVAARPYRIVAEEQPVEPPSCPLESAACVPALVLPAVRADDQLEQVEDRPVLDDQPAVHVGFAEPEPRILDDVERDLAIREAHRQVLPAAASEGLRPLARAQQGDAAFGQAACRRACRSATWTLLHATAASFALFLCRRLQLAASGVDVAAARRAYGRRNARLEDDVAEGA